MIEREPGDTPITRCRNPVEHYQLDADAYDYFTPPHPVQADIWKRLRDAAVRFMTVRTGMQVLDVGSGGGWLTNRLQSHGIDVISIDLSHKNLERVKRENNSTGIMASAGNIPLSDESVDAVFASEVIEHLNDPHSAITEFFRIVKSGGRVVITTPYNEEIKQHLCIHCNRLTPSNAHLHSFDENSLTKLFSTAGATEIYYRRIGNKAFVISRLSYFFRWLPLSGWLFIDWCANMIIRKPAHIIVCGIKKGKY